MKDKSAIVGSLFINSHHQQFCRLMLSSIPQQFVAFNSLAVWKTEFESTVNQNCSDFELVT